MPSVCDDGELQGQLYAGTGSNWSQSGNQVVAIPTNAIAVASNIRTRGFFDGGLFIDIEKAVDDFVDGLLDKFSLKRSDFTKENLNSFLAGTAYGADQNITFGWIAWATGAEERDDDYFFMLAKTGTDVFCLGLFVEAGATLGSIAASGTSIGSGMVAFGMAASPAGGYSLSIAGVGIAVSEAAAVSAIGAAGIGCMAARTSDFLQKDASKVHKMERELRAGIEKLTKSNIKHFSKHIPNEFANQAKYLSKEALDNKLAKNTFFNPNWTKEQIVSAVEEGYNSIIRQGKTGLQSYKVNGETIKIFIKPDGTFDTAYGLHKLTSNFLGVKKVRLCLR